MLGLILIFPNVCFIMLDTIPFVPLFYYILPLNTAKQAEGSKG